MPNVLDQTWDLESIFPGGSHSEALNQHLADVEQTIRALDERVRSISDTSSIDDWVHLFGQVEAVSSRLGEARAFVGCLNAADVKDQEAKLLSARLSQLGAALSAVMNQYDAKLLNLSDQDWKALVADPRVAPISFPLDERRTRARERLDAARETLISDLSVDGYQAWGRLYNTIVGRMTLPFEEEGRTVELSMGQAANKLTDGNRTMRQRVFIQWEKVWANEAELFASVLNHLAGFRLSVYRHRGWDSFLKEPVERNRMSERTLEVMWEVIERNKAPFVDYLNRKARMLGVPKLSWHDTQAPLGEGSATYTYEEAADFVVEQFGRFSEGMASFARAAIDRRWVEAEDRPNKGTGAFCTTFPQSDQTRVFMTFSGTFGNVSTLAHELGHAYHQSVMKGLPLMVRGYAMNVAETASTFAELVVSDAAIRNAGTDAERLALLDDKIQQAVTMFMNIHCRFLFETRFYERRKSGTLSAAQLSDLMVEAQRDAFHNALGEYHPNFWASKGHFYNTGTPFYNFPYTFGYLFSNGIYARAMAEGPSFADKYALLLCDTGRMTAEELARKHLDVDLTSPDFWQSAVDLATADVQQFLSLTAHT